MLSLSSVVVILLGEDNSTEHCLHSLVLAGEVWECSRKGINSLFPSVKGEKLLLSCDVKCTFPLSEALR